MSDTAEHLAELHWICYRMLALAGGEPAPMWNDMIATQKDALISAMRMLLELEHIKPGP